LSQNYFAELAKVNVSAHVEKKGQFSYLSWPFAVQELGKIDPEATWTVERHNGLPYIATPLGYFVEVSVTCKGVKKSQIHPVLDQRNQPIKEPNSFHINTSIQRALVKAIALHGLGLYIYAGEDLPDGESAPASPTKASDDIPKPNHQPVTKDVWDQMTEEQRNHLTDIAMVVIDHFKSGSDQKAFEHYEEAKSNLDAEEQIALWSRFNSTERSTLKKLKKAWEEAESKRKAA
jgi:hypothetical protein